ncbi:MAG: acyl-CoA synthetase [Silicimonas sp.]|nr:acyl-CoA synthetase [Silicimonas sp.]
MDFSTVAARDAIESSLPWSDRDVPVSVYDALAITAKDHGQRPAFSFQLQAGPKDPAETLTWAEVLDQVTQTANLFRSLGVGENDVVACLLPNANETILTLLGGMTAGIVNPINPLLEVDQIAALMRETNAKVLVTLKAFPKTDVPQKAAAAVALAPSVETVLEVDLLRYMSGIKSLIVPLIRPKNPVSHKAKVLDFQKEMKKQSKTLSFSRPTEDRVGAYFHTGGTTGMPKMAQHLYSGMVYNGWLGSQILFQSDSVIMCPLPLFHVFAVEPVLMSALQAGAHVVFPTPAGYRGDGVFDNFWKLNERWKVTFIIGVPTAFSALMQRPVDADLSTVKTAFSGSAPLPVELYKRFEEACGVEVVEGYGLTEATCLVSCNPIGGVKKVGSVGIPFPYTDVKILLDKGEGPGECGPDEVGEICVANPGVYSGKTYTQPEKNKELFHFNDYLRTGDLGRIDEDGYLWITGRAKDLIIRGGHNIDPAEIEEALAGHPAIAMVGAIGQPDVHAGELPCAYVELVAGASATPEELIDFARERIVERAALPKYVEILDELPKTAVGKVFKPDLRRAAITRIYNAALEADGHEARVQEVIEDKRLGLVALLSGHATSDRDKVTKTLGGFTRPWQWAD